jgi:PKD repeat protein
LIIAIRLERARGVRSKELRMLCGDHMSVSRDARILRNMKFFHASAFILGLGASVLVWGCGSGESTPPKTLYPPTAVLAGPYSGTPGTAIDFSGSSSSDPQGEVLTYSWNFGDGGTSSSANAQHTYVAAGTYSVTLTVTDTSGLSNTATTKATVGSPPVANPGGPYTGYYDTPLTFNGSGSSDPQGETLTYSWNWGDDTATGTGVAPTHTYTGIGPFKVTLTVTDTSGLSASASTTVTLGWPPPTVNIHGPYTGKPTLPVNFSSTVTDPVDDGWSYSWQFGDGGTSSAANPQHVYAAAGTYNVSLYVVGQYNDSNTATTTATITAGGAGSGLSGIVRSGNMPVAGAHVYLFAANTTGYGQPSVPLLSGTGYSDANGAYVLSGSNGAFTLPSGFSCATHEQMYVYALGGTVGTSTNPGAGLLSALGACGYLNANTYVTVNEVTTVAAAYAMSGYATGPTQVSSPNTAAALAGIGNAFLNASNLASVANGAALAATPPGNGTAPQTTVNTLGNILNACVSAASSSTACTTLYADAESGGSTGAAPTDTATAAINIAHNQGANGSTLYALMSAQPFTPVLTTAPHDWTMGISFTGVYQSEGLAVDGAGDVWVLQYPSPYGQYPVLTELASNGDVLSSDNTTCSAGTEAIPAAISVDTNGNVWLLVNAGSTGVDSNGNEYSYYQVSYCTVSSAGVMLSPPGGYVLGGDSTASLELFGLANDGSGNGWFPSTTLLETTLSGSTLESYVIGNAPIGAEVAIDGSGNFWVTSQSTNGIVKLSASGNLLSPPNGYIGGGLYPPAAIAIDNAGNAWATNSENGYIYTGTSISKLSSNGTPLSGSGFTNSVMTNPYALAIDGSGNVWIANGNDYEGDNSVLELSPSGALSMSINHANSIKEYLDGPQSIAVDGAGNVWFSDGDTNTVTEFLGVATPVVTPLAANLQALYNAPASKP